MNCSGLEAVKYFSERCFSEGPITLLLDVESIKTPFVKDDFK